MQKSVIIVAGGSGSRMQHDLPKQFIKISGKPLMVHTIEAFLAYDPLIAIVLVLPEMHLPYWQELADEFLNEIHVSVTTGGSSRFQSVKAGLQLVEQGLVAIHDAVRPAVPREVIARSFDSAAETGSGVVMVPLKDSLRQLTGTGTVALDRSEYQVVQTPQTFRVDLIKEAFQQEESTHFTDDASVYEAAGMTVSAVLGDYKNIKVTTPEDLLVVEAFLRLLQY